MKALAALSLLLVCGCPLAADTPPISKFTTPAPALRLIERSDSYEKGSFARWVGKVVLTGKVVIEFDRAPPGEEPNDTTGVAFFQPDAASLRKLPSALEPFYPLQANVLWLEEQPISVLEPLLGKVRTQAILSGSLPRYEVPASIRLTEVSTSVECDHRSYMIKYDSLSVVTPNVVAIGKAENIGC